MLVVLLVIQIALDAHTLAAPATFRNQADVIASADYPKAARRAGVEGVVRYRVAISSDGLPQNCIIVESSGNPELDWRSCEKIMQRARFNPARDQSGNAVASNVEARVFWRLP